MNVQFTDKIACIFRHTLALIKENGFHGTPMSMIAKHSDVAIGTIYHYFPSKENLIVELFFYCKTKINAFIFRDINQESSYKEQFAFVLQRFCAFQIENTDIFSFLEQFYNSPFNELAHNQQAADHYEENNLIDFLLKGMEINQIRKIDVHIIAAAYIGAAVTFSKSVIYGKLQFNQQHLDELIEIIWNGVKQENEYEL
ncbi:transcriptional regulator, TetR family [Sphingobacterium nematocida]|uniref:Transcriptional regulator, TetR family n=1 Tax=Sphingobacterium nematocida TaxID=1513896 RepID=A0A1T5GBY4_9SPHI|nr:TetR/AcrR family transcriptional regulator [Sphingobacterium nematocida]SKC05930.1 transcriptional regulator, TetR family [Sphingobacterium nematocida]